MEAFRGLQIHFMLIIVSSGYKRVNWVVIITLTPEPQAMCLKGPKSL